MFKHVVHVAVFVVFPRKVRLGTFIWQYPSQITPINAWARATNPLNPPSNYVGTSLDDIS